MDRKDKKKIKKQIKKQVKKQIKKQIKRNIRTPSEKLYGTAQLVRKNGKRLTPEEQSKQIEAMKVMLTRPGVVGFQSDPQYRDLIQKNQQLDERINQRQALLNSMRAGIEQKEQREKEYDQKRIDLKKLQKEHKEESEHKKRMEDIQDKIDDLNEDMRTLKGEDEVETVIYLPSPSSSLLAVLLFCADSTLTCEPLEAVQVICSCPLAFLDH